MEVLRGGRLNASQSPLIRLEGKGSGGELELRNTHLELNVKDLNNTINEMADKLKSQADYIRTIVYILYQYILRKKVEDSHHIVPRGIQSKWDNSHRNYRR